MSLFEYSKTTVPVYPELVELTKEHEEAHWHEDELNLQQDIEQWESGIILPHEKKFVTNNLLLFTASDEAVAKDYIENLLPVIKNNEARNAITSIAGREGVHQRAYSLLSDTLGFGEEFHEEFLLVKEMKKKYDWMVEMSNRTEREVMLSIAKQILIEGVSLFGSFALFLNFLRYGKLIGAGDANIWSARDETIHVKFLVALFKILCNEYPKIVDRQFKKEIYELIYPLHEIEAGFIKFVFESDGKSEIAIDGVTSGKTIQHMEAMIDYRLIQLGLKPQFKVENPFEWFAEVTGEEGGMMEYFFETTVTNYSKNSMIGSFAGGYG